MRESYFVVVKYFRIGLIDFVMHNARQLVALMALKCLVSAMEKKKPTGAQMIGRVMTVPQLRASFMS